MPQQEAVRREKHENNFHLLRLMAALQVAFVHLVEWLRVPVADGVLFVVGLFPGVPIFFAISGYLIADSCLRTSPRMYATHRMLRIYPALWVCFAVTVCILAGFGQLNGAEPPKVWAWALGQVTFFQYTPTFLEGYGTGSVNGVLWTIMVELQFYVALPFILRFIGTSKARFAGLFFVSLTIGVVYLMQRGSDTILDKALFRCVASWLYIFLVGVFLRLHPELVNRLKGRAVPVLMVYLLMAAVAAGLGLPITGNDATPLTTIPLAVFVIAMAYTLPSLSNRLLGPHDISYGIYIYHMVVVNVLVHTGRTGTWVHVAMALLIAVALAAVSWVVVERPALRLKAWFAGSHARRGLSADAPVTAVAGTGERSA